MPSHIFEDELRLILDQNNISYTQDGIDKILYYFNKLNQSLDRLDENEKTTFSIGIPTVPVDGPFEYRLEYKYLATLVQPSIDNNLVLNKENVEFITKNNPYIEYENYFSI